MSELSGDTRQLKPGRANRPESPEQRLMRRAGEVEAEHHNLLADDLVAMRWAAGEIRSLREQLETAQSFQRMVAADCSRWQAYAAGIREAAAPLVAAVNIPVLREQLSDDRTLHVRVGSAIGTNRQWIALADAVQAIPEAALRRYEEWHAGRLLNLVEQAIKKIRAEVTDVSL